MEFNLQFVVNRMLIDKVEMESAFLTGHDGGEGNSSAAVRLVIDQARGIARSHDVILRRRACLQPRNERPHSRVMLHMYISHSAAHPQNL